MPASEDMTLRQMRDALSKAQALTVPEVEQVFYQVPFPRKQDALCRVLDARRPDRTNPTRREERAPCE